MEGFYPQTSQTWKKTMLVTNVTAIGVPPDGSFVVVGTDSGKLLFLDSKTGDLLSQELSGNFGSVTAIKFSGNGKWMATTGTDGVVRLFSIRSNP
jgi:WD40 repeat protein